MLSSLHLRLRFLYSIKFSKGLTLLPHPSPQERQSIGSHFTDVAEGESFSQDYRWLESELDVKSWEMKPLSLLLTNYTGLPWWASGWDSSCKSRGQGLDPCLGMIPPPMEQLSPPCSTTAEPKLWSPQAATNEALELWGLCSAMREATAMRSPLTATESSPHLT